ncbi:hypothetical protein DRN74_02900 [Candidatus Micrarchaeota archaeon]|nr:MAG: hypothetical protein DRN74_02900 [Candidatus Micrarchaeota archaeon]
MEKENKVKQLREKQDNLSAEIEELEGALKELEAIEGGKSSTLKERISGDIDHNKKLAQKLDYLLNLLIDASQNMEEDKTEKVIKSLAKSQIKILEELKNIRENINKLRSKQDELESEISEIQKESELRIADLIEEQKKKVADFSKKLNEIMKLTDHFPLSKKIEVMTQEIESLKQSLKQVESKPVSDVNLLKDINTLKSSIDVLRKKIEETDKEVKKITEKEGSFSPHFKDENAVHALQREMDELEIKIGELSKQFAKLSTIKEIDAINQKLAHIESEIKTVQSLLSSTDAALLKKRVDKVSKMNEDVKKEIKTLEANISKNKFSPERTALSSLKVKVNKVEDKISALDNVLEKKYTHPNDKMIMEKIGKISKELDKISFYSRSFPISEAQHLTFLKNEVDAIESIIKNAKDKKLEEASKEKIAELRKKISEIENKIEMEPHNLEHKIIKDDAKFILNKHKENLTKAEKNKRIESIVNKLHKESKEALESVKKGEAKDINDKVKRLTEGLSRIESELEKEEHISEKHVEDVKSAVLEAQKNLDGAIEGEELRGIKNHALKIKSPKKILPRGSVEKMVEIKNMLNEIKNTLGSLKKKKKDKTLQEAHVAVKGAEEKVKNVNEKLSTVEKRSEEIKEKVEKLNELIENTQVDTKQMLENYIKKMPLNVPKKLTEIAQELNIDGKTLKKALIELRTANPDWISLANVDYSSEMLGKEALLLKLKEQA